MYIILVYIYQNYTYTYIPVYNIYVYIYTRLGLAISHKVHLQNTVNHHHAIPLKDGMHWCAHIFQRVVFSEKLYDCALQAAMTAIFKKI